MTDPADRHLAEQYLEGSLHALAQGVSVPVVPAGEDVRRGRRRLLRLRLAMAGGTTATLVVVLGVTGLAAGEPTASEPPIAGTPSTALPTDPTTSPVEDETSTADEAGDASGKGGAQPPPTTPSGASVSVDTDDTDEDTGRVPGLAGTGHGPTADSDPHGGATTWPEEHPTAPAPTSDPTTSPSGSTPTPTATSAPTTAPTSEPTPDPTPEPRLKPTPAPTIPPTDTPTVRVHKVLRYYNDVVADHLDPDRDHLQPYDRKTDDRSTTRIGGRLFEAGSTYRWGSGQAPGGLGVTVASGWDQLAWECGASDSDWDCHTPTLEAPFAEVAAHDGVVQVAVQHDDGQVVVLTADGVEAAEPELLGAAADARLKLPGIAPVSPPRIDPETFASAGVAALVGEGETFTRTSIDRTPEVTGAWSVADAPGGTLSWSARPVYSGAGWECSKTYRSCTDLVVDPLGHVVHVANIKKKHGGGWVIEYDGPAYAVRVHTTDQKFPRKRAYAFVTDESWQPAP